MHDGQPSDEYQLVQRTCAGDREAARILFCEVLGPLAEALGRRWNYPDLPNQLFVHLCENDWRRLRTWKGPACVKGWARAVCRNLFLAEMKARSGLMPLSEYDESKLVQDDALLERLVKDQTGFLLLEAIEMLESRRDKLILRMHYLQSKDLAAIAAELDIPIGTIYVAKGRALARLRRVLEGQATNADASRA